MLWKFACGYTTCSSSISSGTVTFGAGQDLAGNLTWPLPSGVYRAYLLTNITSPTVLASSALNITITPASSSASIVVSNVTFKSGQSITFNFTNSKPLSSSWIGIWPAGTNPYALPSPSTMWMNACGSTSCTTAKSSGTVTFGSGASAGNNAWPLCDGLWQAFIMNDDVAPTYESLASTATFEVTGGSCYGPCTSATSAPSNLTHAYALDGTEISRFAFSSCFKPTSQISNALWSHMRNTFQAQCWGWLGDNVYSDGTSMEYKRTQYNLAKNDPYYKNFGPLALPKIPVMATWDDHDFGSNNE